MRRELLLEIQLKLLAMPVENRPAKLTEAYFTIKENDNWYRNRDLVAFLSEWVELPALLFD